MAQSRGVPYLVGRLAGKKFKKAKWIWESAAGNEEDAIVAERQMGLDLAAKVREESRRPADPEVQALLDDILATLAERVANRSHRFEVTALAETQRAAFASDRLPGTGAPP